jgi:hypothetical protein
LIKTNISTPASSFQMHENRVIRAAILFAQGALLLQQESVDLLNLRHAVKLRLISDGVQRPVPALQRLGRVTKPEVPPAHTALLYVSAGDVASREKVL